MLAIQVSQQAILQYASVQPQVPSLQSASQSATLQLAQAPKLP